MADLTMSVVIFRDPVGLDQPVAAFTGPTAAPDAARVALELGKQHYVMPVPIHDCSTQVVHVWECRATVLGDTVTVGTPHRLAHALLVRPQVDLAMLDRVDVQVDHDAAGLAAAVFGHRATYVVAHSRTADGARELARDRAKQLAHSEERLTPSEDQLADGTGQPS